MKSDTTIQRIIALLESHGVEKRQYRRKLEAITGVSYSGVSQWFNGHTKAISYLHLKAIADHYKVSVDYLIGIDQDTEEARLDQRLICLWDSLDDNQRKIALSLFEGAVSGLQKVSQDTR